MHVAITLFKVELTLTRRIQKIRSRFKKLKMIVRVHGAFALR